MTPEFEPLFRDRIAELKAANMEPEDALREAERFCGRNNEEFNPDGQSIVAEVYGGEFKPRPGGGGMAFIPTPVTVDATPADEAPKDAAPVVVNDVPVPIAEPTPELREEKQHEEAVAAEVNAAGVATEEPTPRAEITKERTDAR